MNEQNVTIGPSSPGLEISDRDGVLKTIAERIATGLEIDSVSAVETALRKREKLASTGLEKGVAVPHCSVPEATRFVAGVITLARPIEFGAIDGERSDIFVYVAGPEERRTEHVRILAALTSQLRNEAARAQLRAATTEEELLTALRGGVETVEESESGPFSIIIIYVQDEDVYEPILETVAGEGDSSVSVSDSKSAGSILHRMPLFATFWNEQDSREIHRIEVVLPRDRVNRAIRQIEEISGNRRGVQVSAIDLSYGRGVLDL